MNAAGISNATAIQRLQQKIEYLQGRMNDPNTPHKALYWARLDIEALDLAIAAIRYVDAVEQYESSQQQL